MPEEHALSSMVITCGDCGARFRLDPALLKGAKGARIHCRRCGGSIVAQSPEVPSVLSAADPGKPGTIYSRMEDLFAFPPRKDAGPDRNPSEENTAEEIVPPVPEREVFPGGRSHKLKYFIIAGLSILLLVGGTLYFGTTKAGWKQSGKLFPAYDIRDVKWSIEKETASGTLFVVKGSVANFGKGPSGGIGIQASLLGSDHQALVEKTAFAGNILDEASLRRMDRPGIAGAMSNRFGEGNVNKEIPPGKALPFMVLFFDPPVEIDAVMVKAIDAR